MRRLILGLVLVAGCSSNVTGRPANDDASSATDNGQAADDDATVDVGDGDSQPVEEDPILTDLTVETPATLTIGEPLVVTARITTARADATLVTWSVTRGEQLEYGAVSSDEFGGELPAGEAALVIAAGDLEATTTLATGMAGLAEPLFLSLSFSADGGTTVRPLTIAPRATDIKDITATAYHGRLLRHDGVVLTSQGCPSAAGTPLTHVDLPPLKRIANGGLSGLFAQASDDKLLHIETETLSNTDDGHVTAVKVLTNSDPEASQLVGMRQSYYQAYLSYADGTLKRATVGGVANVVASSPRLIGLPMLEAFILTSDAAGEVTLTPSPFFPWDLETAPAPYAIWPDLRVLDGIHSVVLAIRDSGDLIVIESLVDVADAPPFPNNTVTRNGFIPDASNVVDMKLSLPSRTYVRWANGDVRFINASGAIGGFAAATLSAGEPSRFSHPPVRTVGCLGNRYCALVVGNTVECLHD